jgi:superfamily II DNA or RNA helicase
MSQLDILGRKVNRKIKIRGREYFERNAVQVLFADADFVSAQVSGSQEYAVDLERENKSLIFSCDCPYFEGNFSVCKHVWATLLELEKLGHFRKWESRFPVELVPTSPDDETADARYEDIDFEDSVAYYSDLETDTNFRSIGYPRTVSSPRSWQHLLNRMNRPPDPEAAPYTWPPGREILYVLEDSRRSPDSSLAIQIDVRDRKKSGEWKKQKPLSISHEMLPDLPDPADREIIASLIGVKRETWYYGPYESIYRFQPGKHDLQKFLPVICRTGRCRFRLPEAEKLLPVQWDEAGKWEFRIDVLPDNAGRQYEIRGIFCRSEEQMDAVRPERVFHEGVLLLDKTIAPFHGPLDWISLFRDEGSFFVPAHEADSWLETMFGLAALPPMNLPEELRLENTEALPHPIVRVRPQKEMWGVSSLVGEVFFEYMGYTIEEHNPAASIALVAERRRIMRNPEIEKLALQKLEQAGFQSRHNSGKSRIRTISQSRLPAAVRNLVTAGWHVEAEGRLFRNPGSIHLHVSSNIDWFELRGSAEFGDFRVPLPRLLTALKRRENTVLLDDGSFGVLPEEWLQKYGLLAGLGTSKADHVRFKRNQAGILDALLASRAEISCDEVFDRVRSELRSFSGILPADSPVGFRGTLRPYQREGLGWLHFLEKFGFGGCLADDMGLGKTIQVLSLLEERRVLRASVSPADRPPPSLVVMPRSLVFNWRQEAERFTPELQILEHTGGERIRGHDHFDDYDVVYTTYGTLRRDAVFFREKMFDYVILDEAQAIKNASTESSKAARLLRGRHRLALSGTPIENHLSELWSLFEFLNPGMLGSSSVFRLVKGSAIHPDEEHRALLANALRPFIMRRTKSQVAPDLPPKVEQTLFCHLKEAQRTLYNELRDHYRNSLLHRIENEGIEKSKMHILEALLRLRQAAIHPGLIDPARSVDASAKLDMLLPQLIEVLDEGHKALIFSQFTSMLSILRRRLDQEKIVYEYLDGQTKDRHVPVEHFQNNPDSKLFLISLKAGGLGLNLTAAEYVYLLDPWWNPAVEAQAVDRTHRIGQTRSVFAYRLIAKDTVEEKVLALQESKREIADAIINQDNSMLRNLRPEDLAILLS